MWDLDKLALLTARAIDRRLPLDNPTQRLAMLQVYVREALEYQQIEIARLQLADKDAKIVKLERDLRRARAAISGEHT